MAGIRVVILSVLVVLSLTVPAGVLAADVWDNCPYGEELCEFPGDCRRYIDTNEDGICDRSQPSPATSAEPEETPDQIIAGTADNHTSMRTEEVPPIIIEQSSGRVYHLVPILLILSVLYLITYLLAAKGIIRLTAHRRIWNAILLSTFLISAILGLFLILSIDFDIDIPVSFDILYWHVEIGIAMGIVSVFHIFWHWRYFKKLLQISI